MKHVVITGAANGIGRALAKRSTAQGFHVLAVDLDEENLAQVAKETGGHALAGSVSDGALVDRVARWIDDHGGECAGLINNAADMRRGLLDDVKAESFHSMLATNILGPILLIQALAPRLERAKGRIVNVGSTNAYGGEPTLLEYSISKAGLACMTRNLAPTLAARGVGICQVNVGWVLTENEKQRKIGEGWSEDWHERLDPDRVPFGRLFEPDEVADFILFLFSPACQILNGSVLDFAQTPTFGPKA